MYIFLLRIYQKAQFPGQHTEEEACKNKKKRKKEKEGNRVENQIVTIMANTEKLQIEKF